MRNDKERAEDGEEGHMRAPSEHHRLARLHVEGVERHDDTFILQMLSRRGRMPSMPFPDDGHHDKFYPENPTELTKWLYFVFSSRAPRAPWLDSHF